MLALTPRAKKKPAAQMQQDQQQVAQPVALQQTKQKPAAPQQGLAPRPAGAPPTPPREAAPLVKAASTGAGAAPAPGATLSPAAPAAGGLVGKAPTLAPGYGPPKSGPSASFGAEQIQSERERQAEIERQRREEENRIAVEEGRRQAASEQQQADESAFTDINKNTSNDTLDAQIRGLIENLVTGKGASTKSEEELIKQLMEDRIGSGLVEQRARMGRAGFGASGALAAMEGDVRRQAAQGATQETLAVRRQAEQDAIDRALQAIGVDVSKRKAAGDELFQQEYLNAIKSALGQSVDDGEDGGLGGALKGATGALTPAIKDKLAEGGWGDETQVAAAPDGAAKSRGDRDFGGMYNPIPWEKDRLPEGAEKVGSAPGGGDMYMAVVNGYKTYYVVKE